MTLSNSYKTLSPETVALWTEQRKEFHLIDVLPNDHFLKIRLPLSKNACVFEVTFMDQIMGITDDRDAEIILYGSSTGSMDASMAAEKLMQAGFSNISVLEGGIKAWRENNLPLEGDATHDIDDPGTRVRLEDRFCNVDPEASTIVWTGRNPNSTHFGNILVTSGELQVQGGLITGTFTVDMHSITNTNLEGDELQPVLISHLKSDDFFLVEQFPSAIFQIYSGRPVEEPFITSPNYEIQGTLELRGVEAEQSFMATVTSTVDGGMSLEAHFDLDRTRWNIIYGSTRFFEHLGMHLVFDHVSIQLRLVANGTGSR